MIISRPFILLENDEAVNAIYELLPLATFIFPRSGNHRKMKVKDSQGFQAMVKL